MLYVKQSEFIYQKEEIGKRLRLFLVYTNHRPGQDRCENCFLIRALRCYPYSMKLSLCMIVKNEEDRLARCLQSVASLVDEMIVVDTGSTDKTVEIAEENGATVFTDEWRDDFSSSRNVSLEKATGDWILTMDADEELRAEDIPTIRPLLEDSEMKGYLIEIVSRSIGNENLTEAEIHRSIRLFRNDPRYRFEGAIHEVINLDHNPSLAIGEVPVTIYHYGYHDATEEGRRQREEQNEALLGHALAANPDDATPNWYLGRKFLKEGKWGEALARFKLVRENFEPDGYLQPFIAQNIISCLIELGQLKQALEEADKASRQFPNHSEFYYFAGEIFTKTNQHGPALKCFKRCVENKDLPAVRSHETNFHLNALFGVGVCSMVLSLDNQASEAFTECLRFDPSDAVALEYLGQLLLKKSNPLVVRAKLEDLIDSDQPAIKETLSRLF